MGYYSTENANISGGAVTGGVVGYAYNGTKIYNNDLCFI